MDGSCWADGSCPGAVGGGWASLLPVGAVPGVAEDPEGFWFWTDGGASAGVWAKRGSPRLTVKARTQVNSRTPLQVAERMYFLQWL